MRHILREGFDRQYVLLPLIAAIALVVTAFFIQEARRTYTRDLGEVILIRQDRTREIAELFYASIEAESAQRGYIITGDPEYVEPYAEGRRNTFALMDSLIERYERTDPEEAAVLTGIRTRLDVKFAEMEHTIALMRDGKTQEAAAAIKTDVGLRYMREIRDDLEGLRERERQRIYEAVLEWNHELRVSTAVNGISAVFTLGLIVLVGLLATREIRRRRAANTELERLVEERTSDLRVPIRAHAAYRRAREVRARA